MPMFTQHLLRKPLRPFLQSMPLVLAFLLVANLLVVVGCSKEEIKEKLKQAQEKVESVAESTAKAVEDKLPETGSITLDMSQPVETANRANLELIVIGDGRPNVVQVLTYDPAKSSRSFPAVLLHGTTMATTAGSLANQTIDCDMYVQATPGGPTVMTKPGGSVAVTFGQLNVEENTLTARLGAADLISADNSPINIRSGELVAVVREGN